jgi:hypothetical protein
VASKTLIQFRASALLQAAAESMLVLAQRLAQNLRIGDFQRYVSCAAESGVLLWLRPSFNRNLGPTWVHWLPNIVMKQGGIRRTSLSETTG